MFLSNRHFFLGSLYNFKKRKKDKTQTILYIQFYILILQSKLISHYTSYFRYEIHIFAYSIISYSSTSFFNS